MDTYLRGGESQEMDFVPQVLFEQLNSLNTVDAMTHTISASSRSRTGRGGLRKETLIRGFQGYGDLDYND